MSDKKCKESLDGYSVISRLILMVRLVLASRRVRDFLEFMMAMSFLINSSSSYYMSYLLIDNSFKIIL